MYLCMSIIYQYKSPGSIVCFNGIDSIPEDHGLQNTIQYIKSGVTSQSTVPSCCLSQRKYKNLWINMSEGNDYQCYKETRVTVLIDHWSPWPGSISGWIEDWCARTDQRSKYTYSIEMIIVDSFPCRVSVIIGSLLNLINLCKSFLKAYLISKRKYVCLCYVHVYVPNSFVC